MTPDKALKKVLQGRRVRHVETGCVWERSSLTGCTVQCTVPGASDPIISSTYFPAYGTFKLLKEKWKPGEVRWQRDKVPGMVWRYTGNNAGTYFTKHGAYTAPSPWNATENTIIDITSEEGLKLIHEMGWNEDGTKYEPAPTLDDLRKLVGESPRVGDVVKGDIFARTVKAVTPEVVVYTYNDNLDLGARSRANWAEWCKSATKIERAK
jgi:hypothetical protein